MQKKIGLQKMGREQNTERMEVPSRVQRSIDIYHENILDYDETPKVLQLTSVFVIKYKV